ncbi:MAG TPA: DUF4198 domain-containing protein [Gemmatimonadales bacterium]|nr:DUF4198 domain-containing protein [Gemmatimonadales bacterium]
MTLGRTDWKGVVGALGLSLGSAALIFAHDLFLKPESFFLPPQSDVRIAVLNGSFTASEASVTPDRLRDLSLVGPAGRQPLPHNAWKPQGDSTWLAVHTSAAGTYLIGASLFPRELTLPAAEFNAYLKEDGIPDVLEARTRAGELNKSARERYQKHVKTLLQVGEVRSDAYASVLGYPAELMALSNPYAARVGETLAFRCLVDGKPAARQLVVAGGEQGGKPIAERSARSDSDGVVRFTLDAAGKWYVKFIHMEPVSRDSLDYESKWATLTFELR